MNQEQFNLLLDTLNNHSFLENAYYVSSLIISLAAIIALWQLKIAKTNIQIRSSRESIAFSAHQIERYCNEIIPLIDKIYLSLTEKNIDNNRSVLLRSQADIDKESAIWMKLIYDDIDDFKNIIKLINSLESFSIYFTRGIADEEVAFYSISGNFVETIKQYSPFIALFRENNNSTEFSDLFKLYDLWKERDTKNKTEKKIEELNTILKTYNINSIKPIGS